MANDRRKPGREMDRFEPLTLTVNAYFELTTVNTVNERRKSMILQARGVNC